MVKIVVDSGSDMTKDMFDCAFESVPLHLHVEDKTFIDDVNLDANEFLACMEASNVGAKSAAPSPSAFVEAYQGDEPSVFVVTLSSRLSGTYQSAMLAKDLYLEEYGKKFIHVFDSLSASMGEGIIALKVAELAKNGLKDLEIVEAIAQFRKHMGTYFLLDKFDNLVKTGRVKPYIAKIASMLNIKPICGADEEGQIKVFDKARGYNKAVKKLIEIIRDNTTDIENRIVGISHCQCYEKAVAFKDELLKVLRVKDVIITEAKGLITIYANRGGFVVSL
jgi:DegV family protein with EDD domain